MDDFLFAKHNPWWKYKQAIKQDVSLLEYEKQKFKHRHPFIDKFTNKDGIFILRGPRRIGKTTLIKLIIAKLLKTDTTQPRNIFFYPCDRIFDFNNLYDLILNYLGQTDKGKRYIFLDEVSFVKEWQRAIKDLWDSGDLSGVTMVLTGSNALDLKISAERLPGRRGKLEQIDIDYFPLRFDEFLKMVKIKKDTQELFMDYVVCGGFPQAINEYYKNGYIPNYLYDVYLNWIEGDIYKVGKSEKLMYEILKEVIKHLSSNTSWYKIAKNTNIGSHSTVQDYLDLFEKLYLTFYLHFYSIEQKKSYFNKNKKIYFNDPVILHSVKAKIEGFTDQYYAYSQSTVKERVFLSRMVEGIVATHVRQIGARVYYGNYKGKEIDLVIEEKGRLLPIEVKYQNTIRVNEFSYWNESFPLVVITKSFSLKRENLIFIPLENFLSKFNSRYKDEFLESRNRN